MNVISHIEGNLYVGGCWGGALSPEFGFAWCLSMIDAAVGHYDLDPATQFRNWPIEDGNMNPGPVEEAAAFANEHLDEGPMLIHCQGGLNRSGVVAARLLMIRGRSADDAISLLRQRRDPMVLCNPHFDAWLRAHE